jgi:hypothetical protein
MKLRLGSAYLSFELPISLAVAESKRDDPATQKAIEALKESPFIKSFQ